MSEPQRNLRLYQSDGLWNGRLVGSTDFGVKVTDYELYTTISEAMIYGSLIRLMTRRLAS